MFNVVKPSAKTRASGPEFYHSQQPQGTGKLLVCFSQQSVYSRTMHRLSYPLPEDIGLVIRKLVSELPLSDR